MQCKHAVSRAEQVTIDNDPGIGLRKHMLYAGMPSKHGCKLANMRLLVCNDQQSVAVIIKFAGLDRQDAGGAAAEHCGYGGGGAVRKCASTTGTHYRCHYTQQAISEDGLFSCGQTKKAIVWLHLHCGHCRHAVVGIPLRHMNA